MSHIGRGIKQNHTNIPKNILKRYHIPKINQKILYKNGNNKKREWFWHTTAKFNSKRDNSKSKEGYITTRDQRNG